MSRINSIRIVNLNYNNNAIHVDDELYELGTESTLFSLRNGGGKSVLVQMMSAPFVRKRYRDTKDRPFESYFTSNRPTYILVEWALDGNNGYVLTGMMVRKAVENREEEMTDPLDTIQFIYEYRSRNDYDIYRFPLISKEEDGKKLLGFGQAKQLFETLKKDMKFSFNYYDMNLWNQNKSYFDKLKDYGINHKEWESIIKKINLKESGLSELFAEAKDESGLIDKWFLPAIEDKLSKDDNRIDKFVELLQKYIRQYRENRANFAKKETIDLFKEETKALLEQAIEYQSKIARKNSLENHIANLVQYLKQLLASLSLQSKELNLAVEEINRKMNQIECNEIAYQIYLREDAMAKQMEQLAKCERLLTLIDEEQKEINQKIRQYECSKVHEERVKAQSEMIATEAKLEFIHRKDEDLAPERNNLGFTLRHVYEEQLSELMAQQQEQEGALLQVQKEQEECSVTMEQHNATIIRDSEENGTKKSNVKAYDQVEEEFNLRFGEKLSRNIVGSYEEELLTKKKEAMNLELEQLKQRQKEVLVQSDGAKHKLEEKEHRKSELQIEVATIESQLTQLKTMQEEFEHLIAERKTLLPYVGISEEEVFDTAKIVEAFEAKRNGIREQERKQFILEERKTSELEQMKSGKVMQLPKEMEEKLASLEFHYLYGTDWLKNNGKSQEENQALVKANPFIPYAILLGTKEFQRLESTDLGIHTSFPIPIVRREELEAKHGEVEYKVYRYPEVSFYVSFNQNLLDKAGLERLIVTKSNEVEESRKRLQQLQEESRLFEEKKNVVLYQKFSKAEYEHCLRELKQFEKKRELYRKELEQTAEQIAALRKEQLLLIQTAESIGHSMEQSKEKQQAFERLVHFYEEYLKDKERCYFLTDEIKRLRQSISEMKLASTRLKTKEQELRTRKEQLGLTRNGLEERAKRYEGFESGELLEQPLEEMEARFLAITQDLHQEESLLTEQLASAKKRYKSATEELMLLTKNYGLQPEDYESLTYHTEFILSLKTKLSEFDGQKTKATEDKMKISNEMTRLKTQIYNKKEEYEKKSGGRELIARDQITQMDFEAELHTYYLMKLEKKKEVSALSARWSQCQAVLTGLSEYEDIVVTEPAQLQIGQDLNRTKNELLKEYKAVKEEVAKASMLAVQEVGRLLRIPAFADEYYHRPLETLERLVDAPDVMIEQLSTTIAAYDNLLEKLSVDLQLIEQEGDKVLEILLQYVQEVHENLGKIDRNSTITIRDRSIKMLKIKLPDWAEEKRAYELRCKDLVEHLVNRALELLDENQNIEELVASQITTKNLYHTIVGVGNIEIHLYKIEEEREYPITWAEVSKNSGGEGFLSAFVILSSLLSYMRRDDTDLFQDKDSGKVLIMDNPFAQTNAAHLLIPLMDIAKKSNTQLICLSGLGGESIYNRFDNIYVLNLVSSKIQDSMQYLYADHIKGEDLENIISTRIKMEEEQMVLF